MMILINQLIDVKKILKKFKFKKKLLINDKTIGAVCLEIKASKFQKEILLHFVMR